MIVYRVACLHLILSIQVQTVTPMFFIGSNKLSFNKCVSAENVLQ